MQFCNLYVNLKYSFRDEKRDEERDDSVLSWELLLVSIFSTTTVVFLLTTACFAVQLARLRRQKQQLMLQQGSHTDCSSCASSCASTEKRCGSSSLDLSADRQAEVGLLPAATCLGPRDWSWYPDQLFPAHRSVQVSTGSCGSTADSSPGRQLD